MERLIELVAGHETWLVNRVLRYAREHKYTPYTSTLAEDWRLSIQGLTASLVGALRGGSDAMERAAEFGIQEARRHRSRGVSLGMFLGLLKCYRRSYRELVREADWDRAEQDEALEWIDRVFDRIEIGLCAEWCDADPDSRIEELQKANRSLSREKHKYLTIFESFHEPAMVLDRDGLVENLNAAASRLFEGFEMPEGAGGDGRCVSGPPAELMSEIVLLAEANSGEAVVDREIETGDGPRRFRVRATRMSDVSDKARGTLLTFTDITEVEQIQASLRYRGQLARLVSEVSTQFVAISAETTDEAIEDALRQIGQFVGADSVHAFRFSDDGERFSMTHQWQSHRLNMAKERLQELETSSMPWWSSRLRAGEVVALSSLDDLPEEAEAERSLLATQGITALLDVPLSFQGELIGFVGIACHESRREWSEDEIHLLQILGQVVTSALRRRRAEQALAQERSLLRVVIDHLPDYIFVKDANSRFLLSNEAHLRLMRAGAAEDIVGKTDFDIFPRSLAQGYFADERSIVLTGESLVNREETVIDERGHRQWLLTTKVPWRDHEGRVVGIVGVSRNITERKRMEESLAEHARLLEQVNADLQRRNQDLDEFTYVASHDLQEPLRKLTAFSDLLREDLEHDDREGVLKDLQVIMSGAQRMQQLVQDLLALSRSGRQKMNLQPVHLDRCVDRALEALELRVRETSAEIVREKLPQVRGDLGLLTQLYQNLIGNALKFHGDAPPRIELFAQREGDGWRLGVRDNGIGIKPEYATQVFAPFRRLHGRGQYEGTGIGLAICRKIVERHGGEIWVESELGKGASFLFTLNRPRQEEAS